MPYTMIATWKMALEGVRLGAGLLGQGRPLAQALCAAVRAVEDDPAFHSVGYGGWPNRAGEVQTDAGYMDGTTFHFGAVAGVRDIANPIDVAFDLSHNPLNCLLCGDGAESWARAHGHGFRNMLTEEARRHWRQSLAEKQAREDLAAYAGHDTVCMVGRQKTDMAVAVSTSGLFLKQPGRVGDSPIIGSGFYCDSAAGGVAATGMGEDVMRGCLSYEVVRRMGDGQPAQAACRAALEEHVARMARAGLKLNDISLIAMDAAGGIGAATTLEIFPFVTADEAGEVALWVATAGRDDHRRAAEDEALGAD